jgi:hypothetical protein
MKKSNYFNDGLFRSEKGEVIEVKLINGIPKVRFSNENKFNELIYNIEGSWFESQDYSIRFAGDAIFLTKGNRLDHNPELFQRI